MNILIKILDLQDNILYGMSFLMLLVRPAKVNKIKFFSGLYYIIKRIPTLVSGAEEPV